MSIVNSSRVDCKNFKIFEQIRLKLQTINNTTTELVDRIITAIPKEFSYNPRGAMRWYKRDLGNKPYDILIGMNLLSKVVKTIDFDKNSSYSTMEQNFLFILQKKKQQSIVSSLMLTKRKWISVTLIRKKNGQFKPL